jgi:16S rRNA (guanine527-N7)-methyltransferase
VSARAGGSPASPPIVAEPEELGRLAAHTGLELSPEQCSALLHFSSVLLRWNRVHNLTAIRSGENVLTHHLLDSLAVVIPIERARAAAGRQGPQPRLLDAGSGGGLPAIPIAIARPRWRLTLVDAVEKKVAFLRQAAGELALTNVRVLHERLAALPTRASPQEGFDAAISRAFSSLADFVALTRDRIAPGGIWLAMKGRRPLDEIAALPRDVQVVDIVTLRVPRLEEERHLVVMRSLPQA